MRAASVVVAVALVLMGSACSGGPTEREIIDSLNDTLRSVNGDWIGISTGTNPIRLEFKLQEGSNGQVTGSGTMKEENAPSAVPITVTGTFNRPALSLTFQGLVYEGHSVEGTARGNYTSVGGIVTTLNLSGTDYSRQLEILLQES